MKEMWRASAERMAHANITAFLEQLRVRRGLHLVDYAALYDWSIAAPSEFWSELVSFAGVRADWGDGPPLLHAEHMIDAKFFPTARLNFAENLLRRRDGGTALIFRNERGTRREMSFAELYGEVARIADGLRSAGVRSGDRVAAFLPNIVEAVVAALATASVGAIWSACSPDFGLSGVLDRFRQIAPTVLITADGYFYAGKTFDSIPLASELSRRLPSVRRVVLVPYVSADADVQRFGADHLTEWRHFGKRGSHLECIREPFDHPLCILYSSGTTGVPKCIVHGSGGTLLQHLKEHSLHVDLHSGDRLFYFTTCGWMMWNWQLSALATGASLVLYDGSPFHPSAGVLWDIVETEQVTALGVSPRYLSELEKCGYSPGKMATLHALRTLLSTGSPLSSEGFAYVYREIKSDLHLASISGGTDIVSCFALGCPILPVHSGELQCRGLGMRVEVFDDCGRTLVGERGELVCTAPFPSMPIGFWNDADRARYRSTYFERFPGVWHHGDYAALNDRGGLSIHGRSDAVLKPGGVRIGTAEIYAAVETLEEILESIAIGQTWEGDIRIVLFVRLAEGCQLDDSLSSRIRAAIRTRATPRHVPARILAVPEIPRTRSGKLTEVSVREIVQGREVTNREALVNPEALDYFRNRPELQS